jgi:hypothetical protein
MATFVLMSKAHRSASVALGSLVSTKKANVWSTLAPVKFKNRSKNFRLQLLYLQLSRSSAKLVNKAANQNRLLDSDSSDSDSSENLSRAYLKPI